MFQLELSVFNGTPPLPFLARPLNCQQNRNTKVLEKVKKKPGKVQPSEG
jgi:hypothetical protein